MDQKSFTQAAWDIAELVAELMYLGPSGLEASPQQAWGSELEGRIGDY